MNDISDATIDVDYKALSITAIPHYGKDCHMTVKPVQDRTRFAAETASNDAYYAQVVAPIHALGTDLDRAFDLEVIKTTVVKDDLESLRTVLAANVRFAQGKTRALTTPLTQHLGGHNSPSLVRVPLTEDGRLDGKALNHTVLQLGAEMLAWQDYALPSPHDTESYTVLDLFVTDKLGKERALGHYFDLDPHVVAMNTLTRKTYTDPMDGIRAVSMAAVTAAARAWTKEVLECHRGWSCSAQLHVRVDLGDFDVVIDQGSAEDVARGLGIDVSQVSGTHVDLTGYPIVNGACRPRVRLRVLDEPGIQRHFAMSPHLAKLMGRDNDGDVVVLHDAPVSVNGMSTAFRAFSNTVFGLLHSKGIA